MMKPMQQPQMQSQMGTPQMSEEELKKLAQLIQQTPDMQKTIQGQEHELGYMTGTEMDAMETVRRDPGLTQSLAEQGKNLEPTFENGIRAFPGPAGMGGSGPAGMGGSPSGGGGGGGSSRGGSSRGGGGGETKRERSARHMRNDRREARFQAMSDHNISTPNQGGNLIHGRRDLSRRGGRGEGVQNYGDPRHIGGSRHIGGPPSNEATMPQRGKQEGGHSWAHDSILQAIRGGGGRPRKFKDMNGKEWGSQAEADASNERIRAKMKGLEDRALTTDSTIERFLARNKDSDELKGLTDEQIRTAYSTAQIKSREDAETQVPAMVESMNAFMEAEGPAKTFEEFKATLVDEEGNPQLPPNLSEATLMDMYANAVGKKKRGDAFTLTPEEVAEFSRDAVVTEDVIDAEAAKIGEIGEATDTEVGDVADVTPTEVEAIKDVTDQDLDAIFAGGADKAEQLLLDRIEGRATSPAEQQLKRTSEANLRMLLGATAGGDADPAKVRQLKNTWQDMTQFAVGEAADLRSQESLAAEKQLIELYKDKDTKKLNTKLANMEKEKQLAMKNGDLALAGKLANQSTMLSKVITQANLTKDTKLANLETMKQKMIEQGKLDMATNIANLQKNVTLAQTDAELAVQSRAMDDAVAMNAYKGQQALYGLEAEIDLESTKNDLTRMGFDLQRDLAELDAATQREVAKLTADWRREQGNNEKQAAIIGAIGTIIGGFAASDVRAKTSISPGAGEVESFLDALNEYKYEYKEPAGDQAGMFVGVMAQDLEKSPLGASFVKDTPKGKMVDYGHGLAAILASQANLHHRIRDLEEG